MPLLSTKQRSYMMPFTPLHVVIIGGGIGGLCLAQGLKKAGVSVAVYERNATDTWLEGYRIHINPVGSQALYECLPPMLWELFVATTGKPPAGLGFLTEQLQELIVIAREFMAGRAENPIQAHYPSSRIVLRQLLLTGLEDVVHYNKTFERYERDHEGKVTAYFADGTSASGDVLIGADGANSRVRQQYLPQARRVELGVIGLGGKVLLDEQTRTWLPKQLTTCMNLIIPPEPYCLFNAPFDRTHTPVEMLNNVREKAKSAGLDLDMLLESTQDYLLWGLFAHASAFPADIRELDEQGLLHVVNQIMQGWHPKLRRLITESVPNSVSFNMFKSSTLIEPWESTNVTLLGDAIHNMPPVGGLGGNMALRDAHALALALTSVQQGTVPLLTAIQNYEAGMREHGFAAVRSALGNTQRVTTNNRVRRLGIRTVFRTVNAIPPLKRAFEEK